MSESPLLKLRQAFAQVAAICPMEKRDRVLWAILDAEESWEAERKLHKDQAKRIRKQRHEYIQTLRWLYEEAKLYAEYAQWGEPYPWQEGFDMETGGFR